MRVETRELGTLDLSEDKLGKIALYATQAADLYEIRGLNMLAKLARMTAIELFDALEKAGRYDDVK